MQEDKEAVVDAVDTIKWFKENDVAVKVISGDNPLTVSEVARRVGVQDADKYISLEGLSAHEVMEAANKYTVFGRVTPEQKSILVKSMKAKGHTVAMTGDGVNDSPALKEADIGVAMGITGTDVAKDAADMILLDDNFTTIEYAVREGRRVYRNIQKVIQFLVAGNIAEILTLFLAFCLGWEDPILAIHILLINLATDSLPAIALGVDPADRNVMKVPPVKSGTLFERGVIVRIALHGLFITAAALSAYWIAEACFGATPAEKHAVAMTMTFLVMALSQLVHSVNQRSNIDSIFAHGGGRNKFLTYAIIASLAIVVFVSFVPGVMGFFDLVYLEWYQYLIVLGLALFPLIAVEISKIFIRMRRKAA